MSLVMLSGPAVEPVSLDLAKAHLRIDGAADDSYIAALIETSRLQIEAACGLALVEQRWRWTLDQWPAFDIEMPVYPVRSVEVLAVTHANGASVPLSASTYRVDGDAKPPRILTGMRGLPEPGVAEGGISIEFTAGFGPSASDVPAPIRQALLLLVAHWYEHREADTEGDTDSRIPNSVSMLLAPYRVVRL